LEVEKAFVFNLSFKSWKNPPRAASNYDPQEVISSCRSVLSNAKVVWAKRCAAMVQFPFFPFSPKNPEFFVNFFHEEQYFGANNPDRMR
jgi:hypothetical protein